MPYLIASIPYFRCLVRREFTRNLADRHGEYIPAVAYGVRCVRGHSLWFQVMLMETTPNDTGGASFLVPIQALAHKPCDLPPTDAAQPWDCFSSTIGICEYGDYIRARPSKTNPAPITRAGFYVFQSIC